MKLGIEHLGKIKEAKIEIKNLTIFVGQNSTNKSYMAHVIYETFKYFSHLDNHLSRFNLNLLGHINVSFNSYRDDTLSNIDIPNISTTQKEFETIQDIYYFPSSRTGFILAHNEIYSGIFRNNYKGQSNGAKLGDPTIDFIQRFTDIKTIGKRKHQKTSKTIQSLINFLEKNIIKGTIKEEITEQNYINYYLSSGNKNIEIHMSSSSVMEALPFVVFLKNTTNIKKALFVIEEPEAHLHPKAQLQMAKFIVMLSNAGAKVVVTTHSDYILGEINNCIKKYELNGKSDFSISKDDVSAYLFKDEGNETTVKELEIDNFGISDENFKEALDELLDESGKLTDEIVKNEK